MADTLTGDTATDAMKGELIVAIAQRELIAQGKLINCVNNVSQYAEEGVDTIKFPKATSFSVTKKASGTAVDATALTYTNDELLLDQHAVIQWLIEKKASKQSKLALEMDAIKRAAAAHAKQVDTDIYNKLKLASSSAPDHRVAFAGATLALADILGARELLDLQNVPDSDRFMAINPTEEKALLSLSDFIDASKWGSNEPVQNGVIGKIFGMSVVKSTVVTAGQPVVFHREAVAFGLQSAPSFEQQSDLANMAQRYSLDQIYGVEEMQGGKMAVLLGSAT